MKFKKTIILFFMLICFCVVSFIAGMRYNSNKKLTEDRKFYVNQFYFRLDNTIRLLSSVNDWGRGINNTDLTANQFQQLLTNLDSIKLINEQGQIYMINADDRKFLSDLEWSFRSIEDSIGDGISLNNQHICDSFLKDGILSQNEISFLTSLKQDLQNMKNGLYSKETKQENPNLTFKDLSKIVKPFTDKYSVDNVANIGLKN